MKRSSLTIGLAFVSSALVQSSCASDNAGDLREVRPTSVVGTLGPALSLEFRPRRNWGLGLYGFSADAELNATELNIFESLWDKLDDSSRNLKIEGTDIGVAASFYPFDTSAFRIGLGLESHTSRVSFDSDTLDVDTIGLPVQTKVSYAQNSNYLAIPLGWNWISTSGVSFFLDVGPRFRLTRSTHWKNAGGTRIDEKARDSYANEKEDEKNLQLGGSGGIGYSF